MIAPVVPEIAEPTGAGPGLIGALVAMFAVGQLVGFPLAGRGDPAASRAPFVLGVSLALMIVGDLGFVLGDTLACTSRPGSSRESAPAGFWMGVAFAVLERFPGRAAAAERRARRLFRRRRSSGPPWAPSAASEGRSSSTSCSWCWVRLWRCFPSGRRASARSSRPDRAALRRRGFWLASAGILMVALGYGALDGPLPLHFAELLSQAEIAGLYVVGALVLGACRRAGRRASAPDAPRRRGRSSPSAISLAGLTETRPVVAPRPRACGRRPRHRRDGRPRRPPRDRSASSAS